MSEKKPETQELRAYDCCCSEYMTSGIPCPPGKCPNNPHTRQPKAPSAKGAAPLEPLPPEQRRVLVDGFGYLDMQHFRKSLARVGLAVVPVADVKTSEETDERVTLAIKHLEQVDVIDSPKSDDQATLAGRYAVLVKLVIPDALKALKGGEVKLTVTKGAMRRLNQMILEGQSKKPKTLPERVVAEVLDEGLQHSTWARNFPDAYNDLLRYRVDIALSVEKALKREAPEKKAKKKRG